MSPIFIFLQTESKFSDEHKKLLFGEDGLDSDKIFEKLDFDKNGEVCLFFPFGTLFNIKKKKS